MADLDWLDDLEAKRAAGLRGEDGASEAYEIAADAAMPRLIEIARRAHEAEAEWRRDGVLWHRGPKWNALVRALEGGNDAR